MSTQLEYFGKTALVTGAGRGIGLSIASRLAEEGACVIIADVNDEKGLAASQNLRDRGLDSHFIHADLSVPGGAVAMIDTAAKLSGDIDILVNNARAGRRLGLLEETEENWDQSFEVGLKAAFFASQATIRLMAKRGGCCIVTMGSVAGMQITMESPSYHAAKSGLQQLTRYLAVAGGAYYVRANCILPGLIVQEDYLARYESDGNAAYRAMASLYQPMGEVGTERDIAEAVLYLCSSRAKYVSGACLTLDGAATAQESFGLLLRHSVVTPGQY